MITEALCHFPGIGPARLRQLRQIGVRSWHDVLAAADRLPVRLRPGLVAESERCLEALAKDDVAYLVQRFAPADKWRIIAHYLHDVTFFDIETTGLDWDARITVIVCWHRGRLHPFVEHENLDEFLDLLDEVKLLASFNGCSFDVPRVLDAFHIPRLPCPHIDLRWSCYHRGIRGCLEEIAERGGIRRPADLAQVDGAVAVQLWEQWTNRGDRLARERLLRYCAADVLTLALLARRLAAPGCAEDQEGVLRGFPSDEAIWACLPAAVSHAEPPRPAGAAATRTLPLWGSAGPSRLRALRGGKISRPAVD